MRPSSSLAVVCGLLTLWRISAAGDNWELREDFELNSKLGGDLVEMIGSVPRLRIVDRDISV